MREHEARLLADSLRTSRLTLLYAGAGASRSALLAQGVVPLLGRREADSAPDGFLESRVVAPFIDRRGVDASDGEAAAQNERVVYVADGGDDPLAALSSAIRSAVPDGFTAAGPDGRLADVLESICERLDARLLIILDAFERFWASGAGTVAADRFVEAFGEAVDRPHLRVNFLLAVDDRFEGRLDALRRSVPGFDDSTVRLLGFERGEVGLPLVAPGPAASAPAPRRSFAREATPPTLSDAVTAVPPRVAPPPPLSRRKRPTKAPLAPPAPIKTDGVYAFIESTLTQIADASEPWHDGEEASRSAASVPASSDVDRSRLDRPRARRAAGSARIRPPGPTEPPSPIDDWLDAAVAWCRRLMKSR